MIAILIVLITIVIISAVIWYLYIRPYDSMPQLESQKKVTLEEFCTALRDYEGKPGDLNYRNNNPGNCRCSPVGYLAKYGNVLCVDTASGKFAKFSSYELGWEYLLNLVHYRANLHPKWNLYDFFGNYAPSSDKNDPDKYAESVAKVLGISPYTHLEVLLNSELV